MIAHIGPLRRRSSLLLAVLLSLAIIALFQPGWRLYAAPLPPWRPGQSSVSSSEQTSSVQISPPTALAELLPLPPPPEVVDASKAIPLADDYCHRRFTAAYLEDLRDHAFQYCADNSSSSSPSSSLTCFHGHARDDDRADSFCLATGAVLDRDRGRFVLDCAVREPNADQTAAGIVPLADMLPYWYETGPRTILNGFVDVNGTEKEQEEQQEASPTSLSTAPPSPSSTSPPRFVLLVKREGNGNLWHCLLEIWAMTMSFDVLRMSRGADRPPSPRSPSALSTLSTLFRYPDDMERTQVVVLDDHDIDGPTYDLWRLFSHQPAVRLRDVLADPSHLVAGDGPLHLVLPLSGGSNPLWQNDWTLRGCGGSVADAPLLGLFVHRVLDRLGLGDSPGDSGDSPITVTFLDRRSTRRLVHQDALLDRLRATYAGRVTVRVVDMAELTLAAQIAIVQQTDVLVGVHGAALTHAMFMREGGGGALVEIQPAGMGYRGFRNLATMRGLHYFTAQAEIVKGEGEEEQRQEEKGEKKEEGNQPEDMTEMHEQEQNLDAEAEQAEQSEQSQGGEGVPEQEHHDEEEHQEAHQTDHESDQSDSPSNQSGAQSDQKQLPKLARRDGEWQFDNVRIEEDRFLQLLDAAIKSQYSVGMRNWDVAK